jgi:hypothetical protein
MFIMAIQRQSVYQSVSAVGEVVVVVAMVLVVRGGPGGGGGPGDSDLVVDSGR